MKRILLFMLSGMLLSVWTANAATLSLSAGSVSAGVNEAVLNPGPSTASGAASLPIGPFDSYWNLLVDSATDINIVTVENRDPEIVISGVKLYDGASALITAAIQSPSGTWTLSASLAGSPAAYLVRVFGTALADGNIYSTTIRQVPIPIPACLWLFGSALIGLLAVSRRGSASLAV